MTRKKGQGSALPVIPIDTEDAGDYKVTGGAADAVYGVTQEEILAGEKVVSGPADRVILLSDSDLRENGGAWKLSGGPATPISVDTSGVSTPISGPVKAAYSINGDSWTTPVTYVGNAQGECSGGSIGFLLTPCL